MRWSSGFGLRTYGTHFIIVVVKIKIIVCVYVSIMCVWQNISFFEMSDKASHWYIVFSIEENRVFTVHLKKSSKLQTSNKFEIKQFLDRMLQLFQIVLVQLYFAQCVWVNVNLKEKQSLKFKFNFKFGFWTTFEFDIVHWQGHTIAIKYFT
jgi:hypothetical protein